MTQHTDRSRTLQVALAATASGILMQASGPPLELWPLVFVALVPLLVVLRDLPPGWWGIGGFWLGLVHAAVLIDGLAKWGAAVAVGFTVVAALPFAVAFGLAGLVQSRLPIGLRPYATAAIWLVLVHGMNESVYTTFYLCSPVSLHSPVLLAVVEVLGTIGLEALVVFSSSAIAALLTRHGRTGTRRPAFVLVAIWGVALASTQLPTRASFDHTGHVIGVQPNIHWSDYAATGWSLERRSAIEDHLDLLTRTAAARNGTIVWPENGNGLANGQLLRRVAAMRANLAGSGSDLLAPGREFETGREYLTVHHFTASGLAARIRKSNLVPFVEADLEPGEPGVVDTRAGRLGVSICYDSLFPAHIRALVERGAAALVVTTDDSSFGGTSLPRHHLAYSVLHAAQEGRSLAFISNEGPGALYDASSRRVSPLSGHERSEIYSMDLPLSAERTWASLGLRHLIPGTCLLGLFAGAVRRRGSPVRNRARNEWLAVPATLAVLVAGVGAEVGQRMALVGGSGIAADFAGRVRGPSGIDALGPLFLQSAEKTCGATALAFALTALGDRTFEEDIAREIETFEGGTTLAELARVATARGFTSQGWHGDRLDDLRFGPGIVQLLHIDGHHFVVVVGRVADEVHLLDPAEGAMLRVSTQAIEQRWTGYALEITPSPASALARYSIPTDRRFRAASH